MSDDTVVDFCPPNLQQAPTPIPPVREPTRGEKLTGIGAAMKPGEDLQIHMQKYRLAKVIDTLCEMPIASTRAEGSEQLLVDLDHHRVIEAAITQLVTASAMVDRAMRWGK